MAKQLYTTGGSYSWTCPAGVYLVDVYVWGAGGGGGGGYGSSYPGGGGGSGGYSTKTAFSVIPGSSYTIVVGTGGTGGFNIQDGQAGTDSYFNTTGTVLAHGASGGTAGLTGEFGGAGGADGVGTTHIAGRTAADRNGATPIFGAYGGGGNGGTNGSDPLGTNGADGAVLIVYNKDKAFLMF